MTPLQRADVDLVRESELERDQVKPDSVDVAGTTTTDDQIKADKVILR